MNKYFGVLSTLVLLLLPTILLAKDIRVTGRKTATITTATLKLSDLAEVSSTKAGNEDALIALKKIQLANTIKAGEELTLSAQQIIEKLKEAGVDFNTVGYIFPKVVSIKRTGRKLERAELQTVMEQVLSGQGRDLEIKNFNLPRSIIVPTGEIEINARMFSAKQAGQVGFAFEVKNAEEAPLRFELTAMIDEWQDIPVAARPLARGAMINEADIKLERYNVAQLPKDVAISSDNLAGYSVAQDISIGEVFRRNRLSIPPLIHSGAAVTIIYKRGALEAKATGTAIESGARGDEIRVRNDASRKIILGRVIESGVVGVGE